MILKLLLGLRNGGHEVNVVKINGETRSVLGTSHPEEEDRRAKVARHWGGAPSPRQRAAATIDEPLPQRSQTILSYRVDPELRQRLNSGVGGLTDSRLRNQGEPDPVPLSPSGDNEGQPPK